MKWAKKISEKLNKIGKKAYIVWWRCRDNFLGVPNYDIDIATDAIPDDMKSVLNVVKEVWKKYWTMIILEEWESYECTTFREDIWILNNRKPVNVKFTKDLIKDASRRDFTINAIYFDLRNDNFVSPVWWIEDVKNKIIRFVWNPEERLEEDVLRMLRFVRFKFKYWLKSDKKLDEIFKNKAHLLKNISCERIKSELDKIIMLDSNVEAFEFMSKVWILKIILPEVDILNETAWGTPHHLEWNVFIHTMMALKEVSAVSKDLDIRYAVLLHDIWKYDTLTFDWDRPHYFKHEVYWADKFLKIANRYRFTNESTKKIKWMIYNHLKIYAVLEMRKTKAARFMLEKYFEDLLFVFFADSHGKIPVWTGYEKVKDKYTMFLKELKKVQLKTWKDIIKMYPNAEKKTIWELIVCENNKIFNTLNF